eukprot:761430-Hanusia_phi.AAC.1
MPRLVCLDVSFNEITALPAAGELRAMSSLRSLRMQNCMLSSLAAEGQFQLAPLVNLQVLDLSFNLLSDPSELLFLTQLQRLTELGITGNEWCEHADYEASCSAIRRKIATLKKIDSRDVLKTFVGYGRAEGEERTTAADALSNDRSSCSCVEGNVCLSPDNCSDWSRRFSIAHKARLEKYWKCNKNFCDL